MTAPIGYTTGTGTASSLADPLVKILWSDQLHKETLDELYFNERGMIGSERGDESTFVRSGGTPIMVKDDFTKERGQRIRMALRKQLTRNRNITDRPNNLNAATYGPNTMVGNEEQMDLYDFECIVELLKHAVSFDTPEIQNLRTNFRMDVQAKDALGDWARDQKEESIVDGYIEGNAAHVIAATLATATAHPNSFFAGGGADADDVQAGNTLSAAELRRMWAWARTNNINPIRAMGQECYILLAPVFACNDLDADEQYRSAFENAAPRGYDNPLFTRAEKKFEGIFIHEYNRIRTPASGVDSASKHECLLLGANSLVLGNASKPRLVRRKEDEYEDRYGVGIKQVFGAARSDFANAANTDTLNQSSARWVVWSESTV
jgi:hypothetical protein